MNELGAFTFQSSFLNLLKKDFGDINVKQKFIDMNLPYLDADDLASLNKEAIAYKRQLREGSTIITATCTLASLIIGIARLPARKSPVRYTVGGFALGVTLSYGFWRVQLSKYDRKINQIFRNIVRDKYNEEKGIV